MRLVLGELTRFTRSGGYFGTFLNPAAFRLMNFTAIETRLFRSPVVQSANFTLGKLLENTVHNKLFPFPVL